MKKCAPSIELSNMAFCPESQFRACPVRRKDIASQQRIACFGDKAGPSAAYLLRLANLSLLRWALKSFRLSTLMPRDWRDALDAESAGKLNDMIISALKHRRAYDSAPDPRVAQLWLAFIELCKRQIALEKKLEEHEEKLFGRRKTDSFLKDLDNY